MAETKMNTGKVRLSYPHLFAKDQNEKYSLVALIPKTDTVTVQKMVDICKSLYMEHKNDLFKGLLFEEVAVPYHDGDGRKPKGGEYGPECKGHYVLSAKSKSKPLVIGRDKLPITDEDEVYPGTWARVSIGFGVYNNSGNRGITCFLNGVKSYATGERFGTTFTADGFDDGYDDSDLMEDEDEI